MSVITVTATVEPSTTPPRVRLNIADTGTPALTSTTITRQNPDGTTVPVRTGDGQPLTLSGSAGLLYDYEAPYQAAVTYSSVESPSQVTTPVTVPESRIWLVHPGVPSLSMPIGMMLPSLMEEVYPVKQGIFYPMGRKNPVVQTDGVRSGIQSTLVALTENLTDAQAVRSLVADAGVLLLNIPTSLALGFDTCYVAVGEARIARLTDANANPTRTVTLPITVVDRPSGGTQSQRTYADLLDFPTYASLLAAFPTYGDLLAGP